MGRRFSTEPRAVALVLGMALGSVVMWIGVPLVWVLLAAQVSEVGHATFGPLLMVLIGAPLTMIPVARVLSALDRRHQELMGTLDERREAAPWHRSMRDTAGEGPQSVLAVVMVVSVAIAGGAFGIWFLFLAGSPPGSISAG